MRFPVLIFIAFIFFCSSVSAKEFQGTLKHIQETGIIKIGYRDAQPPMSYLDKDGVPSGYSVELCSHIVDTVETAVGRDVTVEYVLVSAVERFEAVANSKIDILCGNTTNTLARREIVDFTQLTFVTGGSYLTKKGRNIKNNFSGKKIGVVKNTTTAVALEKLFAETGTDVEFVLLDSTLDGFNGLKDDTLDVFSADQVVLIGLILKAENPSAYAILPDMFSYEPIALAVRRDDSDFRLIADRTLAKLYRTGEIEAVYDRWFGLFSATMPSAFEALIKLNAIPEE